jgi:hypothetical protein
LTNGKRTLAKKQNPYSDLPPQAFWRTGVAEAGVYGMSALWSSCWTLPSDAQFSTYGSCFAQHISRALIARRIGWLDAEPAPARTPAAIAATFGYGVFSSRTGNIYTAAQLLAYVRMATDALDPKVFEIWEEGGRHYDSLRPAVEPNGFASAEEALLSRRSTVRAFRRSIVDADVFVFTLGLTEGWENAKTGLPYPMCPGTLAGQFDPKLHVFRNYGFVEIHAALTEAFGAMRKLNPNLHILMTVSPVPLTATASGQHVLVATTFSKSVLRAVAGELAASDPALDYFPSYEIITGPATRSSFYEPNLRSVVPAGVDVVMGHFFGGLDMTGAPVHGTGKGTGREAEMMARMAEEELACEEMTLEGYNEG